MINEPERIVAFPFKLIIGTVFGLALFATGCGSSATESETASSVDPMPTELQALAADPIPALPKPTEKAERLGVPSYIDPVYRTHVYKVTHPNDFTDANRVRHDYSRRQAFNADNSRFIGSTSNGYWVLYDAVSFQLLPRSGFAGAMSGMAGDAEPVWHPTDPQILFYNQEMVWYEKNVESDRDEVMADFSGRLPWPEATHVWTKAEGTSSADGRYWALMATSYDDVSKANTIHGLLTYDREEDRIIGTLGADVFGGSFPDHISISPSGRWAVPSWAFAGPLGTRAYSLDFSEFRQLHSMSEHSDLAIGPDGQDMYVYTDYDTGAIRAVNIDTGATFDLLPLYPRVATGYAAHISGQAFSRPGWVVVSTYADNTGNGTIAPDPIIEPMYRKIILIELKPDGRKLSVAHTRAAANYGGYFGEHQATISRDGSRIMFATNFDDGGPASSYMVLVPPEIYD